MVLRRWGVAASHQPRVDVGAEHGERDFAKASEQQFLRVMKCVLKCCVHGLFDEAARGFGAIADGEERGTAQRCINVAQRHFRQVAGQRPPAAMSLFRVHIPLLSKTRHDPPDHHRIGVHHLGQVFRCDRSRLLRHVEQDVKYPGKSAVSHHVTYDVT